jgi:hypothetical protein
MLYPAELRARATEDLIGHRMQPDSGRGRRWQVIAVRKLTIVQGFGSALQILANFLLVGGAVEPSLCDSRTIHVKNKTFAEKLFRILANR